MSSIKTPDIRILFNDHVDIRIIKEYSIELYSTELYIICIIMLLHMYSTKLYNICII